MDHQNPGPSGINMNKATNGSSGSVDEPKPSTSADARNGIKATVSTTGVQPGPSVAVAAAASTSSSSESSVNAHKPNRPNGTYTPLIRLHKLPTYYGLKCQVYIKADNIDPTGLATYPLALQLLEAKKTSNKAQILTTQNFEFALGLAFACAAKQMPPPVFTILQNKGGVHEVSNNDLNLLKCLGTRIVQAPLNHRHMANGFDPTDSLGTKMKKALSEDSESYMDNGKFDALNKKVLEVLREVVVQTYGHFDVFACEPSMAEIIQGNQTTGGFTSVYDVASIEEFVPNPEDYKNNPNGVPLFVYNDELPKPKWLHCYKISKALTRTMSYALVHEEGFLCSQKSGRIVAGAIEAMKGLGLGQKEDAKVIIYLTDNLIHSDLSWFSYDWMVKNGIWTNFYMENTQYWWWETTIPDVGLKHISIVEGDMTIRDAINFMKACEVDRLGIILERTNTTKLEGVILLSELEAYMEKYDGYGIYNRRPGFLPCDEWISNHMATALAYGDVHSIRLKTIAKILTNYEYLIVTRDVKEFNLYDPTIKGPRIVGILGAEDVILYKKTIMLDHLKHGYELKG